MRNIVKIIGATALVLGVAVAIPVLGHGYGDGYGTGMHGYFGGGHGPRHHMMNSYGMPYGQMNYGVNFEQHLAALKESLQLTAEQQPAWTQYEQAVKNMAANGPWSHPMGNTGDDMESHFEQMQGHFTQMKAVFDAQKALYDTLTDQQKETINTQMPGPMGHQFGSHC